MNEEVSVYPYKRVTSGKFTTWTISITEKGNVLVEHYFKNKLQSQSIFENQNEIKWSKLPKDIKQVTLWACYEAKSLLGARQIDIEKDSNKWF